MCRTRGQELENGEIIIQSQQYNHFNRSPSGGNNPESGSGEIYSSAPLPRHDPRPVAADVSIIDQTGSGIAKELGRGKEDTRSNGLIFVRLQTTFLCCTIFCCHCVYNILENLPNTILNNVFCLEYNHWKKKQVENERGTLFPLNLCVKGLIYYCIQNVRYSFHFSTGLWYSCDSATCTALVPILGFCKRLLSQMLHIYHCLISRVSYICQMNGHVMNPLCVCVRAGVRVGACVYVCLCISCWKICVKNEM